MFPAYDLNPIAIEHMQREKLRADTAYVDRQADQARPGGATWRSGLWSWFRRTRVRLASKEVLGKTERLS